MKLTANNKASWIFNIWTALEELQDIKVIVDNCDQQRWDDICTAMAWIAEELEVNQEDI